MTSHDLISTATQLRDIAIEHREDTEAGRNLAPALVAALRRSGLCRMALSNADGGLEIPPLEAMAALEIMAAGEASLAWVVWNSSLICWFARFLSPEQRREVFADAAAMYASSTRPTGRAVRSNGDYVVNGRWSLVSGCHLASWIPAPACVIGRRCRRPSRARARCSVPFGGSSGLLTPRYGLARKPVASQVPVISVASGALRS
jgi:alkylation response protein AidB-like acyl-CoA dehydrogenase